ncbi:MAG: glutamate--tRNA ligase [bacterium]|nr:glutamate--tRNA ligase [bacterium]
MSTEEEFKLITPGGVRTRIAPSPTGFLHIGLARTALFNYLFAKKYQGSFVLRIEDTDLERSSPEFEKDIIESLKWLGIDWSEGPDIDGQYGPYRQRERLNIYAKYLEKLLAENKAYHCFCSEEELEAQRQYQMSIGETPRYTGKCANLDKELVQKYLAEGKPSVIRFRIIPKKLHFDDLIRGRVEFDTELMGDIVIAKNLETPLYNFAVVIDDFEMKISHVIRGEDHISNTPKQILMQEALGLSRPIYGHLPLILGPDRTKLSKRHATVSVSEYRKEGYLAESLINFMAFLGWNPGDEREIYSMNSLVKEFSLDKVQKGGAIFNIKRLDYLNGFYIRQKSIERLLDLCLPFLKEKGLINDDYNQEEVKKIIAIHQERLKKLSEIAELADFFFKEKLDYDKNLLKWDGMEEKEIKNSLEKSEKILSKIQSADWKKENLQNILMPEAEEMGDRGKLLWPLRVALTGKTASAGPFDIADILGKEKTIKRIKEAKDLVK